MFIKDQRTDFLFPTPVTTIYWDTTEEFNQQVNREVENAIETWLSSGKSHFTKFNFFEYASKSVSDDLRRMFNRGVRDYIKTFFADDVFEKCDLYIRSWPRIYKPGQMRHVLPHCHTNVNVVATYYSHAPMHQESKVGEIAPGATVIVDTRGLRNMGFEQSQQSCVAIDPRPGLMIVMPAHAMHYVEPITDHQEGRSVVVCNAVLLPKNSKYELAQVEDMGTT